MFNVFFWFVFGFVGFLLGFDFYFFFGALQLEISLYPTLLWSVCNQDVSGGVKLFFSLSFFL